MTPATGSEPALERGVALLQASRFQEALASFSQALRADPAGLAPRLGLARACAGSGDLFAAAAWLSDAIRVAPQHFEAHQLLADVLLSQKLHAQALPVYAHLLGALGLRTPANLLHGGFCQEMLAQLPQAAALYREAIAMRADFMEAHVDLAGILWRMEDFEGSLRHAGEAVALSPDHPFAVRILGTALLNLNRLDEAEVQLRRALDLQPAFVLAELDLAFCLLLAGRYPEGWPLYESRWRDTERVKRPVFFQPDHEWQGPQRQPQARQRLAVYAEQGLGDVLQFIRYLPQLQAAGAQVACSIQQELVPLIESSFPGVEMPAPGRNLVVQQHVALLELPGRLGTTLDNIPAQVPYLAAPEPARQRWRERLAPWSDQRKVGLAWSGSTVQVNNRNRALPLGLLAPLVAQARLAGVAMFSLQKGDAGDWTDLDVASTGLVDLTGEWQDFGDSAAMVEQLDLVITVDTAIAHLAGALGKPVWVLLPPNADWRWLLERDDSPWYPTARLFRRDFGEARSKQVARMVRAFEEWLRDWWLRDPA